MNISLIIHVNMVNAKVHIRTHISSFLYQISHTYIRQLKTTDIRYQIPCGHPELKEMNNKLSKTIYV